VSTSEDDEGGGSNQPGLESIMEASLLDDCGGSSVFLDRIMEYFRSWNCCRDNDRPVGRDQNLRAVQVAGQKAKSTVLVSTLSGTE